MEIAKLFNALPSAVSQGVIWGIMAIGVYITYRILDFPDLTVDSSFPLGAAVSATLTLQGVAPWLTLLIGCAAGGILLGLLTAVLYGCIVLSNKQLRDISAYDRTLVQLFITTLVLIPYCILHGDFVGLQITGGQLALLLILGVVHTGFAYSLYFGSMAYLPAQTLAILSYLDPVTAVLLSALVLHEPLSGFEILGAVCILGAAVVSELPGRVKKM